KSLQKKAEALRALAESAADAIEAEIGKRGSAPASAAKPGKVKAKAPSKPAPTKPAAKAVKDAPKAGAAKAVKAKADPARQVLSHEPQQKNLRGAVKSQLAHSAARGRRNQARRDAKR